MRSIYSWALLLICTTLLLGQARTINIRQHQIEGRTWLGSCPEVTDQALLANLPIGDLTAPTTPYQARRHAVNIASNSIPGLMVGGYKTIPAQTSDLIVVGTVSSAKVLIMGPSSLQDYGVATDYDIQVETVLKDATGASVQAHAQLTVTREGGYVRAANGKVFAVTDPILKPLHIGSRYVLFITTIPEDNTLNVEVAHELSAGRVAQVEQGPLEFGRHKDKTEKSFVQEVKRAIMEGVDQ